MATSSTTTDLLPPKKTMPKFTFWSCCKGSNKDDNDETEEEQTGSETTTLSPKPIVTETVESDVPATKKQPPVIVTSRGLDIEKFNDHQTIPDLTSLNSQEAGSPASTIASTDNNNSNNNKFALVVHPASPRSMDAATKALMELFKIILHIMFIDKVFPSSSNKTAKSNDVVQQEDIPDLKVNETTTVEPVPVIA